MTVFELAAKLTLDSTEYEKGLKGSAKEANEFAKKLDSGINKLLKIGAVAAGAAVAGVTAFSKAAVNTGMQFDAAMSQVAATMGVTTDEIQELRDYAQQMGATTAFSATQAAQALNYMALAGYDAKASMSMLPSVLNLAAAGSMDLARASDMLTDSQSALGLTLDETNELVDKMAQAASKSNTSVEQLGDAILTVGGTAKNLNGGTTELATALGILADNGVKGAEGGTALRNIILALSAPTETASKKLDELGVSVYDAEGNMRALNDIFGDLDESMSGLTQEQRMEALATIFNSRDLKSAEALLANYGLRWDELSGYIDDAAGAAEKMAETQLDNLNGDITLMKSALEGAKIALSDGLTPSLRNIVQMITKALSSPKTTKFLNEVGQAIGKVMESMARWVSNALPRVIKLFQNGAPKVKAFAIATGALVVAIKATVNPLGALLSGLGLLVGGLLATKLGSDSAARSLSKLSDEQWDNINNMLDAVDAYKQLNEERRESFATVDRETKLTQDLWKELQTLVDENGKVKEGQEDRVDYILGELNSALGTEYKRNGDIIEQYQQMQGEIDKLIQKRRAEHLLEAGESRYQEAISKRADLEKAIYDQQNKLAAVQAGPFGEGYDQSTFAGRAWYEQYVKPEEEALTEMLNLEQQYTHDINQQETAYRLASEGNYEALEELYANDTANRYKHMVETGTINQEQISQFEHDASAAGQAYDRYLQHLAEGDDGYTEEGLLEKKAAMEELQGLYQEAVELFKQQGDAAGEEISNAFAESTSAIGITMFENGNNAVKQFQAGMDSAGELQLPPIKVGTGSFWLGGIGHAGGLDYVPYDNYAANLHRGEAVLTAREAEEWRRGEGSGKQIVNNFNFNGVSQSDLDMIVSYVNRQVVMG